MVNDCYRGLERIGIRKSGCVESGLHWCTVGNNTTPTLCRVSGVAIYFFALVEAVGLASDVFVVAAVAALALAAQEPDLGQSLALWPVAPQNMHRFILNLRLRSSEVSLPSLPSLSESSAVLPDLLDFGVGVDNEEDWAALPEDLPLSVLPNLVLVVLVLVLVEVLF